MRVLILLFLVFTSSPFLIAQIDGEKKLSFEDHFKKSFSSKPKLDVKFDNRFSFIRDNDVKTVGVKVGLSFDRKFKLGLGINTMVLPVTSNIIEQEDTIAVQMEYVYISPYIEYVYFSSKKWEFSLSAQIGLGGANHNYLDKNGDKQRANQTTILSYEPATLIDYKIIRWIGIGTGVGYRLIFYKSPGIKQKFSSPEYVLKLKIYLGEIYRTITGREIPAE
ncbi:MAG: hypothetical protein J5I47_02075 [Vicingus serpentipes]|nr:hypothetical protein [Vicingus serpentipes]